MRVHGKITKWNDEKGFGFITPIDGGKQVFVHIKAFADRSRRPAVGSKVNYELASDLQGRLRAENAMASDGSISLGPASVAFVVSAIFLAWVAWMAMAGHLPIVIPWLYLGMSLLTFCIYALDKSAARKDAQRTPEKTLHLLSLLCGWPGALYAQQALRHKSRKRSFQIMFWLTLAANVSALIYLLIPQGTWLAVALNHLAHRAP